MNGQVMKTSENGNGEDAAVLPAEKIVNEMNVLDLSILELTHQLERNRKEQMELDCETDKILKELKTLDEKQEISNSHSSCQSNGSKNIDFHGIQPIGLQYFKAIPETSIHSDSIDWSESSETSCLSDNSYHKASEVYLISQSRDLLNLPNHENGDECIPCDLFWDARGAVLMAEHQEQTSRKDSRENFGPPIEYQELFKRVKISEFHEEVMELLRTVRSEKSKSDDVLSQQYLDNKQKFLNSEYNKASQSELCHTSGPANEYEEWKNVVCLWGAELLYGIWEQLPDQCTPSETFPCSKHFVDRSRRILNPEADLLENFESKPWTEEEKKIFMEKFIEHPKDFYKIAQFLSHRTTGDCIQFFYANKKTDEFGNVRRKQQLKKRRIQSESNKEMYSQLLTVGQFTRNHLVNEQQKRREIRSWILHRIDKPKEEFPDQQLLTAVRKFGLNYKAIAKELGCTQTSSIASYILIHRRRLGLDDLFETQTTVLPQRAASGGVQYPLRKSESTKHSFGSTRHPSLTLDISRRGSDQLPSGGSTDLSLRLPVSMPSHLSRNDQDDQMKAVWQKMPHYSVQHPPSKDWKPS